MNELEKRRVELLTQTRNTYKENYMPAIHPRYGTVYRNLYPIKKQDTENVFGKSTLRFRIMIALLCFIIFALAEYNESSLGNYTCEEIVAAVSQNIEVEKVWNSW